MIRPWLTSWGHIPETEVNILEMDRETLSAMEISTPENAEYLQVPWTWLGKRCVIRGTSTDFPDDGPLSLYAALFDQRNIFNAVRYSLLRMQKKTEVDMALGMILSRCPAGSQLYMNVAGALSEYATVLERSATHYHAGLFRMLGHTM